MDLWAVTMVKDEIEILPYTLRHLELQGVSGIIVADNLSTDGTWEYLQGLKLTCDLMVERDPEIGYYQSDKMTRLAHEAFAMGADWVLPFDADELWYSPDGTLRDQVEATERFTCLDATLYNYYPTSSDDPYEPNPFLRIQHRDPTPAKLSKVLVASDPNLVIAQGNHDASLSPGAIRTRANVEIAHFPYRSPEQFERKVRNGHQAYLATDLPDSMGSHWRGYGLILDNDGSDALREVYDTWFCDPPLQLEIMPAPWEEPYDAERPSDK